MKRFEQYKAAIKNLEDIFSYDEPYSNVVMADSPRMILKTAFKAGMISEEELWLSALISRKNAAHAYNKDIAMDIIKQTKENYFDMFVRLVQTLEQNWN